MEQLKRFLKSGAPFRRIRPAGAPAGGAPGGLAAPGEWTRNRPPAPAFRARLASREEMAAAQADWARLAERALEPGPFAGPDFLLSAARHLTFEARPRFVAVHDAGGRLAGVFPLAPAALLSAGGFLRLWSADPGAAVPPLVDRDRAEGVLAAFFDWAGAQSLAAGVLFPSAPLDGPLRQKLAAGRPFQTFDARRPTLPGTAAREDDAALVVALAADDIREAVERFLTLDALGRRATRRAAAFDSAQANFVRAVTRLLAAQGRCRAAALDRADRAAAMALILEGDGRSVVWRLAVDPRTGPAAGQRLLDRLTSDRLVDGPVPAEDVAVALRPGFEAACRRERNRRRWRALAAQLAAPREE